MYKSPRRKRSRSKSRTYKYRPPCKEGSYRSSVTKRCRQYKSPNTRRRSYSPVSVCRQLNKNQCDQFNQCTWRKRTGCFKKRGYTSPLNKLVKSVSFDNDVIVIPNSSAYASRVGFTYAKPEQLVNPKYSNLPSLDRKGFAHVKTESTYPPETMEPLVMPFPPEKLLSPLPPLDIERRLARLRR